MFGAFFNFCNFISSEIHGRTSKNSGNKIQETLTTLHWRFLLSFHSCHPPMKGTLDSRWQQGAKGDYQYQNVRSSFISENSQIQDHTFSHCLTQLQKIILPSTFTAAVVMYYSMCVSYL